MIEIRSIAAPWTADDSDVQTLTALMGTLAPVGPRARVLIVDDDRQNRELLARILTKEAYDVETAADGETALLSVEVKLPDLILLDVHLPGVNGFDVCSRLKHSEATRLVPVVLVTGLGDREHRLRGIDAGADDFLAKPFDPTELKARVRSLVRLKRQIDTLESVDAILRSLARTIEARDPYTQGHCERLAQYAVTMGRRLKLDLDQLTALEQGGYLHDIGKIGVPDALLLKTGRLTAAEFNVIKQHTVIGDSVCSELRSLHLVRQIVRHHHERQDGSGYPDALQGDAIPLLAQIVGIADVYDALTTDRPYRQALSQAEAFQLLDAETCRGLHRRDLVSFFKELGSSGAFDDALQ
jgi:putative two-component system response regulator